MLNYIKYFFIFFVTKFSVGFYGTAYENFDKDYPSFKSWVRRYTPVTMIFILVDTGGAGSLQKGQKGKSVLILHT
jgi:hypothetical protein